MKATVLYKVVLTLKFVLNGTLEKTIDKLKAFGKPLYATKGFVVATTDDVSSRRLF